MSTKHFFKTPFPQKAIRLPLRQHATPAEEIFWRFVRGRQLGYKFRRQATILGFVADFYCHDLRQIIELDGFTHDSEKSQARDRMRQSALENAGYVVIRFTNEQVYGDIEKLFKEVKLTCGRRAQELGFSVKSTV